MSVLWNHSLPGKGRQLDTQHSTWMTNTNYVSQALRLVRSLEEVKEELRGLTVRVDGQEETVVGLLESGRFFLIFLYLISLFKINYFLFVCKMNLCRLFMADYSILTTLPLVPGRVFYAPQVTQRSSQ